MNQKVTATSPVLIADPTENIDLAYYYFSGFDFNWKNIAITQSEWQTPKYGNGERQVSIMDDDLFWIRYENVELTFNLDTPDTVNWEDADQGPDGSDFNVTTSTIVPTDPVELLNVLGLFDHPEAGDLVEFWANLLKLFTFIRDFQEN